MSLSNESSSPGPEGSIYPLHVELLTQSDVWTMRCVRAVYSWCVRFKIPRTFLFLSFYVMYCFFDFFNIQWTLVYGTFQINIVTSNRGLHDNHLCLQLQASFYVNICNVFSGSDQWCCFDETYRFAFVN